MGLGSKEIDETMKAYKRPESVLVVAHDGAGRVLLIQRADNPRFWQSVTGSLEAGESPAEAAVRELGEELGIADASGLIDCHDRSTYEILPHWRYRFAPGVTENLEHVFRLAVAPGFEPRLAPAEHLAYRWASKGEAIGLCPSWTNRRAITRFVPT